MAFGLLVISTLIWAVPEFNAGWQKGIIQECRASAMFNDKTRDPKWFGWRRFCLKSSCRFRKEVKLSTNGIFLFLQKVLTRYEADAYDWTSHLQNDWAHQGGGRRQPARESTSSRGVEALSCAGNTEWQAQGWVISQLRGRGQKMDGCPVLKMYCSTEKFQMKVVAGSN